MDKCNLPPDALNARPTSASSAWVFDCYPHPRRSGLVVWIKHGDRVCKRFVPYQPFFRIRAEEWPLEKAEELLADDERVLETWRDEASLWLRQPPEPVLCVRPKRLQDMFSVATRLRRMSETKGFRFYDVDNQAESRWMHEQGLGSMCRLQVKNGKPQLQVHPDENRFAYDYPNPNLRVAHVEVITDVVGNERGLDDPLVAIRIGAELLVCPVPGEDAAERDVLLGLAAALKRMDPDVLTTKHGDRFDMPFLLTRIRRLGLQDRVWLGRDPDPEPDTPDQESKSIHTYGRWLFKTAAFYLRGRWHIDLSKKTLDAEDDRKDIHGILYLARVSNRRAQDVNRNGAGYALQQMQIDLAVDLGTAVPWKRNLTEDWKDVATLCAVDRGGQIMVPTPGIYGNVGACDFSGYYPSLVVHRNLSSDTIVAHGDPGDPVVPELNYQIHDHDCDVTGHAGHQAHVLGRLVQHRRDAKSILLWATQHAPWLRKSPHPPPGTTLTPHSHEHSYDDVQKAMAVKSEHKALGVVCFGYFRYRNARFGCAEVHQAIQCYGRDGMTTARQMANETGLEMVHSMTDCAFFQAREGPMDRQRLRKYIRRLQQQVGVLMDIEGIYRWIVFLPSKVHSKSAPGAVGVPNRYYGKFDDGELKVRGIDVQKHSTPDWIRDVQWAMLHIFQEADTPSGFLARIPRALDVAKAAADDLRSGLVDARKLGTVIQSTKEVEQYTAQTNARTALLRLREAGTERKPGEYLKYVVTRQEGPKESRVVPIELFDQESPWFDDVRTGYSIAHYLRLLARSVETILASFGYWEDALYDWFVGRAKRPTPVVSKRVDVPAKPAWVAL